MTPSPTELDAWQRDVAAGLHHRNVTPEPGERLTVVVDHAEHVRVRLPLPGLELHRPDDGVVWATDRRVVQAAPGGRVLAEVRWADVGSVVQLDDRPGVALLAPWEPDDGGCDVFRSAERFGRFGSHPAPAHAERWGLVEATWYLVQGRLDELTGR